MHERIVSTIKVTWGEFVVITPAERRDRDAAVWFAFGRESAGDVLPAGGGAFAFADAYGRAMRLRRAEDGPDAVLRKGMEAAYVEFMATGTVTTD